MTSNKTLAGLLLLSSALYGLPALAQTPPPDPKGPVVFEEEEEEGQVEIVGPGAGGLAADEIVVVGRNIPNVIRANPSVISVLSEADIARTGEGDIAGALRRVTGLSLVGGRYVYVRGLGERYSLALLNGLPLPSPEPLKRVVPLDLFPTSVVASSTVQKSFSPSYPGEFGGGVINLSTKSIPEGRFVNIGGSVGGNTATTGQLGYTYFGSRTDWTGFDDGTRSVPNALRGANNTGKRLEVGPDFDLATVQAATAALVNSPTNLIQRNDNIPADMSLQFSAGNSWDVGENRLGVVVAFEWDNSWQTRGGTQQVAGGVSIAPDGTEGLTADQDYRFLSTDNNIQVTGLIGGAYEFGEHKIKLTNFFVRDSLKEARIQTGLDTVNVGEEDPINRNYTSWFQRQLFTSQIVGEFKFDDLSVNVRGTWANSQRNSPYERVNSYRFSPEFNDFFNDLTTNGARSTIAFSTLNDDVWAGAADFGYKLKTKRPMTVSAGYALLDNTRDAERRDYRYVTASGVALPPAVSQQRPDFLLSDFNVYTFGVVLREVSGVDGAARYESGLRVHAGYGQIDAEIADGLLLTAGVRIEAGKQFVETQDIFANNAPQGRTDINETYFLPGGTLTWNFAENQQIRVAGSKTIARPQFRELAPQPYTDIDTDRTAIGNPFLIDSKLLNAEGRYEWFFGQDERVMVGGFYKRIDDPIEVVAFESGGTFRTTFANAPRARLYGAEIELIKFLSLDKMRSNWFEERRLMVNPNYTYTNSRITVQEGDTTINLEGQVLPASAFFQDGIPLTGQSDHIFNFQLGLQSQSKLSEQTFLVNYQSGRTTQRGPAGTPDYREIPGWQLDFVLREEVRLGNVPVELKLEARNLLNTLYQEIQVLNDSRIDVNVYPLGRFFSFGMTLRF